MTVEGSHNRSSVFHRCDSGWKGRSVARLNTFRSDFLIIAGKWLRRRISNNNPARHVYLRPAPEEIQTGKSQYRSQRRRNRPWTQPQPHPATSAGRVNLLARLDFRPKPVWFAGFKLRHLIAYVIQPFVFHIDVLFRYSFILAASRALALWSCDAEVDSRIPSSAAISRWLLPSTTKRLKIIL